MKKAGVIAAIALAVFLSLWLFRSLERDGNAARPGAPAGTAIAAGTREISGTVQRKETMSHIFRKYEIKIGQLFPIREAAANVHRLRDIDQCRPYTITLDSDNNVLSLLYHIDEDRFLSVTREGEGFRAGIFPIEYEKRTRWLEGAITTNLIASFPPDGDSVALALQLSDIFAWDIDFTTDLRKGDAYRVVVGEMWLDGKFKRYGEVIAAEFTNKGETFRAYRFNIGGKANYFDDEGMSVRRAFLKAPLSYRRISSGFARSRNHPILKIARPHLGIDYAAPRGTPVSALGDGTVLHAGFKGSNGKLVILRHPNGYTTFYGHLSRIAPGIRRGAHVRQGDVIGQVGATGMATGPHLDFRIQRDGKFLNPLTVNLPRGEAVPPDRMADFRGLRDELRRTLASISPERHADAGPGSAPGR